MIGNDHETSDAVAVAGFDEPPSVDLLPGGHKDKPYRLNKPARFYTAKYDRWIDIPAGFRFDTLSVPWFFSRIFQRGGWGKVASVPHDWLCETQPEWSSSDIAADIFDECMEVTKVPAMIRGPMVFAVRYFGPQWDRAVEWVGGTGEA